MSSLYGYADNRNDSVAYHKSFEQMAKEANATTAKYERIRELEVSIEGINIIHFKARTDAQDQQLHEYHTELSSLTGVA